MKCEDVMELERLREENKELKIKLDTITEYNRKLSVAYESIKTELNRIREKSNYHI